VTSELTTQQLDEIQARHKAATPGPWGIYEFGGGTAIDIAADLHDTGTGYRARREICRLEDEPLDNDPAHKEWTAEEDWAQVQADAAFVAHAREDVPALLAEIRRLKAALAREERLHGDTIDDRDRASDMADKLAYAVAPEEVIGEHTADNSPWANALDLITPKAEVDKLRDRVAELEAYAHGCDGEGCVIPHSSWCEVAKKAAAENGGCTCPKPWKGHPQPHAGYCWLVSPPRNEIEEMRRALAERPAATPTTR
jgi:hypothetical protein